MTSMHPLHNGQNAAPAATVGARQQAPVTDLATFTTPEAGDEDLGDLLLEVLPPDGSTIGNLSAREALSRAAERQISEEEYETVKERALTLGLVVKGRGRGGAIRLANGLSTSIRRNSQKDLVKNSLVSDSSQSGNPSKGILREGYQYINWSDWSTKLDTPCPLLLPCNTCKTLKPVTEFVVMRDNTRGRKDIFRRRRLQTCRFCGNENYKRLDVCKKLLYAAKKRANMGGVEFTITERDVQIPTHCPILGIELKQDIGRGQSRGRGNYFAPTLDRIVNEKGYVPGNVCVISKRANLLKNDGTFEEIKALFVYMLCQSGDQKVHPECISYLELELNEVWRILGDRLQSKNRLTPDTD